MESALCTLLSALVVLLCSSPECKGEDTVTQPEGDSVTKGDTATINCTFERRNLNNYYLFWYKQKDADSPKYMLRRDTFGTESNSPDFNKSRFDAKVKENSVYLKIQHVLVSDSAVYYCAVKPNNDVGNRQYFGSGTRLWVHNHEDLEPSFYPLEAEDTKVCLATGFTHHDKLKDNPLFSKANGTFIDRESEDEGIHGLYSQVAPMSSEEDEENCPESSGSSDDELQPDPTVNLLSLTVLGLRILFIKTVAFNVLLTLRYCISR